MANLTKTGWFNAAFGMVFYLCLSSLAVDSAFSIIEGVSRSISARLGVNPRKATKVICIIAACISIVFITESGLAWLDIVDHWTNQYNMIVIGVMECIVVGWLFETEKVWKEINRNATGYKMPLKWFRASIRYAAPLILSIFCILNLKTLFEEGGIYSAKDGYPLWSNIAGGWGVTVLVFFSGIIANRIIKHRKQNGLEEKNFIWK